MRSKQSKELVDERIIGIVFILAVLLPHTSLLLYLFNPVFLLYLMCRYTKRESISAVQALMIVVIILSLIWNTFYGVRISINSFLRGFYIAELLLFFPFCGNVRIKNIYLYVVVLIILLSQLCYIYNIEYLISLFDKIYPYTGTVESESVDYLVDHSQAAGSLGALESIRFGGLFHNSNQCMKYISLCAVTFFIENVNTRMKTQFPFMVVVITSAFLAGSRTGFFIVLLAFLSVFLVRRNSNANICSYVLPGAFIIILYYLVSLGALRNFRVLDLSEGTGKEGSLSLKYANFSYYWQLVSEERQFLVGNFSIESIKELYHTPFSQFDSEWGNAVYFYGIIFILLYFIFLCRTALRLRGVNVISAWIIMWVISSTILFSYRTSFAFLLVLSRFYSASLAMENECNTK